MRIQDTFQGPDARNALAAGRTSELEAAVERLRAAEESQDAERAGEAFESYFATMLVKELRRSLPDGFFSGSGSDVYGAWFDQHVGEALSQRDALGLAGLIKTTLSQAPVAEETKP
jgi:Rod binding domain-containing protein